MIRLEKAKQLDRIKDENERTRLVNEIRASGPALRLVDQIIKDKISHFEQSLDGLIGDPYALAASVKTVSELRKLTQLFKETQDDNIER